MPKKKAPRYVELIFIREFGYITCRHNVYLPTDYCKICAEQASQELTDHLNKRRN